MRSLCFLLLAAALSCKNHSPSHPEESPKLSEAIAAASAATVQSVGSDTSAHGCKKSAGFTWSTVKNECVRIWEAGTQFTAYGENKDSTLAAYVIYSSDNQKAEIFLPGKDSSILLTAATSTNGTSNITFSNNKAKTDIQFIPAKDIYLLRINNKPLYSYSAAIH